MRDSLGPQLPSWFAGFGVGTTRLCHVADTLEAVTAAVREELRAADVLVSTGGSARGPVDHVRAAIAALGGRIRIDGVAVRPGNPMILAELPGGCW